MKQRYGDFLYLSVPDSASTSSCLDMFVLLVPVYLCLCGSSYSLRSDGVLLFAVDKPHSRIWLFNAIYLFTFHPDLSQLVWGFQPVTCWLQTPLIYSCCPVSELEPASWPRKPKRAPTKWAEKSVKKSRETNMRRWDKIGKNDFSYEVQESFTS